MDKLSEQPTAKLKKDEIKQLLEQRLTQLSKMSPQQWRPIVEQLKKEIEDKIEEALGEQTVTVENIKQKIQDQSARDGSFKEMLKHMTGKTWAEITKWLGGDKNWEDNTENAVAGIRGHAISQRVKTSKKKEKDALSGGVADGKHYSKYDPEELAMGIKVELEHTDDIEIAKEIAKDHLEEDPKYYTKLKKIHDEDEAEDSAPAFWRRNLDYGAKTASGRHKITWDQFSVMGTTTIDVGVVDMDTGKVSDEKEFSGDEERVKPQANSYVRQLKQKYPGSQVQRNA